MDYLLMTLLSSTSSVAILLIATLGLAIIFGLMGVINLAHGEFIMFGAYAALVYSKLSIPFPIAVLLATLSSILFGMLIELIIIRRLYGRILDTMLVTWGLSLIMYQTTVLIFGSVTPGIGLPQSNFQIGEYSISLYLLMMIPLAAILVFIIYYLLTRSNYGIMARASISNPTIAATMGIKTKKLNTLTFGIGTGFAGFAGAVLLPAIPATPDMGFAFVIKAFLTVIVAGPLPITGTIVAGSSLGMISDIISSFYISVMGDIAFFVLTILLLSLFPLGISNKWKFKL